MKSLSTITEEINATAVDHRMCEFQQIRQNIHRLKRVSTRKIFTAQTTHDTYAFHFGGRKEIQFNIGFEGEKLEWLRYGLAFSLRPSRPLPDPLLILKPKVLKLNEYIRENMSDLDDIRFWYYYKKGPRSTERPVAPIPEDLIRVDTFLFFGQRSLRNKIQPGEVLSFFDRILPIYEYVESGTILKRRRAEPNITFESDADWGEKKQVAVQHLHAITKEIELKHNRLQSVLHSILSKKFGKLNVKEELRTGRGSRVDVAVRDGKKYTYYEIKTSPDIGDCLRDAIAQLIEYSYWPGGKKAEVLVVVSENRLTPVARRYLVTLRESLGLRIFYQHLDLKRGTLGDPE